MFLALERSRADQSAADWTAADALASSQEACRRRRRCCSLAGALCALCVAQKAVAS